MSAVDARAELLQELGITPQLQRQLDQIAAGLRTLTVQLEEARHECAAGTDTEARIEEALTGLSDVLRFIEWRAPEPGHQSGGH